MNKPLMTMLLGLMAFILAVPGPAEASAELNLVSAINKAGRQRMLSQRIVKSYAAIGLDIRPEESRRQLNEAANEFDRNLDELKVFFVPTPAIRTALTDLESLWLPFRETALGRVVKTATPDLLAQDAKVLAAAEKVVRLYENYSGYSLGRLVNTAGRQRMLTQRMAKYHLLKAWGVDTPESAAEIGKARGEFEAALWELEIAPQNNYEINRELEHAVNEWRWFSSALEQEGDLRAYLLVVNDAGESLLSSMDFLTSLYEVEASH